MYFSSLYNKIVFCVYKVSSITKYKPKNKFFLWIKETFLLKTEILLRSSSSRWLNRNIELILTRNHLHEFRCTRLVETVTRFNRVFWILFICLWVQTNKKKNCDTRFRKLYNGRRTTFSEIRGQTICYWGQEIVLDLFSFEIKLIISLK